MTDLGKVDRSFFDAYVYPHLGADRDDVALGPQHGVDFGVLDVGGRALVAATDPVSVLPALGFERAARFALDVVLADVAVSGVPPTHLAVSFSLPPSLTDEEFGTLWTAMDERLSELGVSVLTGHTARYQGCSFPWVGGATVLGVGDHEDVIRPTGASPGDRLIVTKGPAVETAGLLTTLFPDQVGLSGDALATAQARLADTSVVEDALVAGAAGPVTAMHDATEGGLQGALVELAGASDVRLVVERDRVPWLPGVEAACDAMGLDPWHCTSSGTLVLTVAPEGVDAVLGALEREGVVAADVGAVEAGEGVVVDGERVSHPEVDPSWAAYAEFAAATEDTPGGAPDE